MDAARDGLNLGLFEQSSPLEVSMINQSPGQSSEVLLARVNHELEKISEMQHRLARRKALLQQQATRLRLGASPTEVRFALQAALEQDERRRWDAELNELSTDDRAETEDTERSGRASF